MSNKDEQLKSGQALLIESIKNPVPLSPAAKLELVMNMLNPVDEDGIPQKPLITLEKARELLGFKDE